MSVDPNTIEKGKCYRTSGDQHRRVYAVDGDQVIYESWGGNVGNSTGPLNRTTVGRDKFAKDVEGEIDCPPGMKPLP